MTEEQYEAAALADCGVPGKIEDMLTVGEFNTILRRVGVHHFRPIVKSARETNEMVRKHLVDDAVIQAKISGSLTTLKIIGSLILLLISGVAGAIGLALKIKGYL